MYHSKKSQSISILIVEDNSLDTMIATALLQNHFTVHAVTNGYDAIKVLEKYKIDIILMDINLGDENMDGIKTLNIIRENKKYDSVIIFAVTACAFAHDRAFFIKEGFDELYIKPVIKEEMFDAINNTLKKQNTVSLLQ